MTERLSQHRDEMTPAQRFSALQQKQPLDRVPILGFIGAYAARISGISPETYYTDMDVCITAQIRARDLHGYDDGCRYGWADWGGWEFGGEILFPKTYRQSSPSTRRHPVEKPADIDRLCIPDPETAGMMPLLNEFNHKVRRQGEPAKIQAGSPTLLAASIVGKQNFFRWLIKEPGAIHAVYKKVTRFIIRSAIRTVSQFGPDHCSVGYSAALDANDLISPEMFHEFVFPYMQRINQALLDLGIKNFHMHLCGNHKHNLPLWTALPWPERMTFSFGRDMDIVQTAEGFGHQHIMAGNLDTTLLAHGTYDEVVTETRRALDEGKDLPGGFILMSGCEMPVMAIPLNVHAMVRTGLDYGKYKK